VRVLKMIQQKTRRQLDYLYVMCSLTLSFQYERWNASKHKYEELEALGELDRYEKGTYIAVDSEVGVVATGTLEEVQEAIKSVPSTTSYLVPYKTLLLRFHTCALSSGRSLCCAELIGARALNARCIFNHTLMTEDGVM
jgi:hypothetical protein